MRYLLIVLVLLVIFLFPRKNKCEIEVVVTNFSERKGSIELAIFNDPEVFLLKNKSFKKYSKKAKSDSLILRLKNIPKGNYAISLYQDVNSDNVCNLSFAGIPKEPFGFSNNYKPFLKKPSFKDCQFSLQKDTYTYTVN